MVITTKPNTCVARVTPVHAESPPWVGPTAASGLCSLAGSADPVNFGE